jgi:hypothetical protein
MTLIYHEINADQAHHCRNEMMFNKNQFWRHSPRTWVFRRKHSKNQQVFALTLWTIHDKVIAQKTISVENDRGMRLPKTMREGVSFGVLAGCGI